MIKPIVNLLSPNSWSFYSQFDENFDFIYTDTSDLHMICKDNILSSWFSKSPFSKKNFCRLKNKIQFLGGTPPMRGIDFNEINGKSVITFRASDSWNDFSRVQLAFYEPHKPSQLLNISTKMWLDDGWNLLKKMPNGIPNSWGGVIFEIFNEPVWFNSIHRFRINVRLIHINGKLHLTTYGQVKEYGVYKTLWEHTDTNFEIKTSKWVELRYTFVDGIEYGIFKLDAKYEDDNVHTSVFNIRGATRHPDKFFSDGFVHWQPIKMYSSHNMTQFFKQHNTPMIIHWTDLKMQNY